MFDLNTVPGFNKYVNKADNKYNKFIDVNIILLVIDFTRTNMKIIINGTKMIKAMVQQMKL